MMSKVTGRRDNSKWKMYQNIVNRKFYCLSHYTNINTQISVMPYWIEQRYGTEEVMGVKKVKHLDRHQFG